MAIKKMNIFIDADDAIPMYFREPNPIEGRVFYQIRWPGISWHSITCDKIDDAVTTAISLFVRQQQKTGEANIKKRTLSQLTEQDRHNEIMKAVKGMPFRQINNLHRDIDDTLNRLMRQRVSGLMAVYKLNKTEKSYVGVLLSLNHLEESQNSHDKIQGTHQLFIQIENDPEPVDHKNCRSVVNEITELRNWPTSDNPSKPQGAYEKFRKKAAPKKKKKAKK